MIAPNTTPGLKNKEYSCKTLVMQEKDQRLGGAIAVAFFGLGAPASLLVGWLSDFVDRRKLFVTIVLVGEVAALATVWVTTYSQVNKVVTHTPSAPPKVHFPTVLDCGKLLPVTLRSVTGLRSQRVASDLGVNILCTIRQAFFGLDKIIAARYAGTCIEQEGYKEYKSPVRFLRCSTSSSFCRVGSDAFWGERLSLSSLFTSLVSPLCI